MTAPSASPIAPIRNLRSYLGHFCFIILPLSLVMAVITADMSNLDFVHLVQLRFPVPLDSMTLPSDDAIKTDQLRWIFLQSAYLLPLMLLAGPVLILQFVVLVGRLGSRVRLVDGVGWILVLTVGVVGLMTLLNAFVGTSVAGVILTKMLASVVVAGALGLVAQAVELMPSSIVEGGKSTVAAGFPTVTFAAIYGLGTAFASCSTVAGYQLASLLHRHNVSFDGIGGGGTQGYRGVFLVEGVFILALCPVICILLMLSRRLKRESSMDGSCPLGLERTTAPPASRESQLDQGERTDTNKDNVLDMISVRDAMLSPLADSPTDAESRDILVDPMAASANTAIPLNDQQDKANPEKTAFVTLRRLSSYCTSPLSNLTILNRNSSSHNSAPPATLGTLTITTNMRALQQWRTGFGLWVSSLLRKIMLFAYGGMGVDDAAFDLISAGTSSRETFICGVLIVSNTVIVQLAVVSLVAPLKAPDVQQVAGPQLKVVPALPGLPTLAGGVSGGISAVVWSLLATSRCGGEGRWRRWRKERWWVPALLTACLVITLIGLGLAVVANIMVPEATCGSWIMYVATIVTYAGSTPQLPLALQQIYTVLDAELGRNTHQPSQSSRSQPTASTSIDAPSSVQAIRWERLGAMISTLTTIDGSELLTAWGLLMPDAAQMVFLFISAVLAIGGSVWLMLRHTRPVVTPATISMSDL
ncbi:uncharacterized protein SPSC_00921 [Sporisorium scitamineum]|uniref:Uncharacterized protein n=1 Tax=Sporisorium scitamineum TaxID=49012 RepID=A0A0F7RUL0_9BASI|nr:hypothetical protein [Sporisorium scitamineum]CDU22291.1 uncharacterized protein SPSC_00921 [Sporisorium scitamineum]